MSHVLDNPAFVLRLDPKEMYRLTCEFPGQCRRALEIAKGSPLPQIELCPDLVVLTGLGGSAAGGDFVKALFDAEGRTPFLVNRDYHLPHYVDRGTLVIASSYSGNTEETLSAFHEAQQRDAVIMALTSGGALADKASEAGYSVTLIPGGQPPRTALGYMLIPVVYACQELSLIQLQDFDRAFSLLDTCVSQWSIDVPFEQNPAKQLAQVLHGKLSVLYGLGSWQAIVANRWKGQINENAKNMTFANAFPELCHNEILGWINADEQGVDRWVAVILEDGSESPKMRARADVVSGLISKTAEIHRVQAQGSALLEKMLSLVLFGDFVSIYLAALNGVDPENIDWINVLKAELSKVD